MSELDVLGYKLNEGLLLFDEIGIKVNIIETRGLNKTFNDSLSEPRILKVDFNENNANVVVGYF